MRKLILATVSMIAMSAGSFAHAGEVKVLMDEILSSSGKKNSCYVTRVRVTEKTFIATVGFVTLRTATLTDLGAPHCKFLRVVDPNTRSYNLSAPVAEQSCGSNQMASVGKGLKQNTTDFGVSSYDALTIQDNRTRFCEDYRPTFQVKETVTSSKGLKEIRHYSSVLEALN